ncbi:AfsR/SARP family transcriptional regulator [Nocardiopsis sp. FIRDI 009]|uniref:AfsR/SARP family transcriptional regulator n=1 Tax=Nocardiopsis sp. FIRDI 009 TaxID=714197 RepID=UPI000E23AA99|nr:AfsR/SARP family transcriptional regulator [Nocardiopsis sp. FIRDI 009]
MECSGLLKVGVLGPLIMANAEGEVSHLPPKPRTVFALVAADPDQVVSAENMVDELWRERPPRTATTTVQTYVGQVRRLMGALTGLGTDQVAERVLITEGGGYRLSTEMVDIDTVEYTRLTRAGCAAASAGDHERAAALFRDALALWRGPALVNVDAGTRLLAQATRLSEARLSTLEHRIRAEMSAGGHADLIGELAELVALYPLHEVFHEYFILALYRSARRAEALGVLAALQNRLRDELGLDLSPRLRALQARVLRDDQELLSGGVWGPGVSGSRVGTTR